MQFRQWTLSLGAAAVALSFAVAAQAGPTLDKVKQAGSSSAASIPAWPASRAGQPGQLDRARRRHLQGARGRRARRREKVK